MLEIWHNPRCSKSRRTLALLEASGAPVRVRRYLEDPPSTRQLDEVLVALDREPSEIVRWGEARARELELRDRALSRTEWLELLVANPILIERPVVLAASGVAVIGRPPENVEPLLSKSSKEGSVSAE